MTIDEERSANKSEFNRTIDELKKKLQRLETSQKTDRSNVKEIEEAAELAKEATERLK